MAETNDPRPEDLLEKLSCDRDCTSVSITDKLRLNLKKLQCQARDIDNQIRENALVYKQALFNTMHS